MPAADRQALQDAMFATQMALGWCFPNVVMQYAVPHLDRLSIDVQTLTRRRDVLSEALTRSGHAVLPPEGTFYLGEMASHVPRANGMRSPIAASS